MYFLIYHINKIRFDEWTLYVHICYFLLDILLNSTFQLTLWACLYQPDKWFLILCFQDVGLCLLFIIDGRNIPLTSQST